jgi:hypothetical protein
LSPLKEIAEETPATVPSHPTRFTKKIRRNIKISPKTKITAKATKTAAAANSETFSSD